MSGIVNRFSAREVGALGIGLAVTVISAALSIPIALPLHFLLSFGLGGTAYYGALKVFDPRPDSEIEEQRAQREFAGIIQELETIATRTAEAGRKTEASAETADRLGRIAAKIEMLVTRYRERPRDFTGAASTLLVLQKFDQILAYYLDVRGGERFLQEGLAAKVISDTEGHVIPMIDRALERLGRKMDSGEASDKDIHSGTLEDMLEALDLI